MGVRFFDIRLCQNGFDELHLCHGFYLNSDLFDTGFLNVVKAFL